MPWQEISPGKFQRTIGENEIFIKLVGDPGHALGREHWAINSTATFTPIGTLAQDDLPGLFLKAWKLLRLEHPSIAAYPINDKTLEYSVPDAIALDKWARETFFVVNDKTSSDIIPYFKPSSYATLTYLPKSHEILGHTSHWRTDGIGVLLLINAFLDIATRPHLPDPSILAFSEEHCRLAPTVEDAAKLPSSPTEAIKASAQKSVATFYQAAGAVGIRYEGAANTIPGGTCSAMLAFSTDETASILERCKAKGFSVTSAVHASVATTNYALALQEDKQKHYTSTIRFNFRPYLPEPYSTPAFASGLYTTGWMKAVPATASWEENAKAYHEEYVKGLSKEFIQAHRQYALDLGDLIRNMPQGGDPPSDVDISSIGVAEKFVERVKGNPERGLEITSVSVGVETLTRQCVCFVWTFRERLNLNLVYNEAFHTEKDASAFVETVRSVLLKELDVRT